YDPLGRLVRIDTAAGLVTRTVFAPWERWDFDADDTVVESPYYRRFIETYPPAPTPEQRARREALAQAPRFFDTPTVSRLNPAGQVVRCVEDALGSLRVEDLDPIVAHTDATASGLWRALHDAGYVVTVATPVARTTVTPRFQPYAA